MSISLHPSPDEPCHRILPKPFKHWKFGHVLWLSQNETSERTCFRRRLFGPRGAQILLSSPVKIPPLGSMEKVQSRRYYSTLNHFLFSAAFERFSQAAWKYLQMLAQRPWEIAGVCYIRQGKQARAPSFCVAEGDVSCYRHRDHGRIASCILLDCHEALSLPVVKAGCFLRNRSQARVWSCPVAVLAEVKQVKPFPAWWRELCT